MFKHITDLVRATKYSVVKQPEIIEEKLEDDSEENFEDDSERLVCADYAEINRSSHEPAKITDFDMMVKAIKANDGQIEVWYDEELGHRSFFIRTYYFDERFEISSEDFQALRDAGIRVRCRRLRYSLDGRWFWTD